MPMNVSSVSGIRIASAANAWPEELLGKAARLDNADVFETYWGSEWKSLLKERGWDTGKPYEKFGVRYRGWTRGSDIGSLELGIAAAEKALVQAGVTANTLDCIICATCSPHQITSTLAGKIARHLGSQAAALDIRAGGAGGLNALVTASLYLQHGCRSVLVIATEASSQLIGPHDLANGFLFGDGAAALLLQRSDDFHGNQAALADNSTLACAVMGNAHWEGKAFTVPGRLPPPAEHSSQDYKFQAPDATYLACLASAWDEACQHFLDMTDRAQCTPTVVLPYSVNRAQVLRTCAALHSHAEFSLEQLELHGCTGCASPLNSLVEFINVHRQNQSLAGQCVGSIAVAGGISWSGLVWQF